MSDNEQITVQSTERPGIVDHSALDGTSIGPPPKHREHWGRGARKTEKARGWGGGFEIPPS